jgi:Flp pilus assembly protein TadD
VSPDELQALLDEATFDHISGDSQAAITKLARATLERPDSLEAWHAAAEVNLSLRRLDDALAAAERAHELNKADPLAITTLSRIWMERGDKARAEHYGALARMQGWKDELRADPPADAGGLR